MLHEAAIRLGRTFLKKLNSYFLASSQGIAAWGNT
jgi:hypothetical protein